MEIENVRIWAYRLTQLFFGRSILYLFDPSIHLIMLVISFAIVSLVCLLVTNTAQAAFSVKYFAKAEHPQVVNGDFVSSTQLTAHQVADIYSRLSGNSPLLFEGTL